MFNIKKVGSSQPNNWRERVIIYKNLFMGSKGRSGGSPWSKKRSREGQATRGGKLGMSFFIS